MCGWEGAFYFGVLGEPQAWEWQDDAGMAQRSGIGRYLTRMAILMLFLCGCLRRAAISPCMGSWLTQQGGHLVTPYVIRPPNLFINGWSK